MCYCKAAAGKATQAKPKGVVGFGSGISELSYSDETVELSYRHLAFSPSRHGGQNNTEDRKSKQEESSIFAKAKKRLPNPIPNPVILSKDPRNMGKKSEKGTYKKHF